jgi:hypothetical protein
VEVKAATVCLSQQMGVELQTKQTLKMLAGEDKADVLELLLEHPQDWSMSAHGLFHKALPTLAGRDLGDEHRELAKRVQKLFTARNRVAHRGERLHNQSAKIHVATAEAAIRFLRKVSGAEMTDAAI